MGVTFEQTLDLFLAQIGDQIRVPDKLHVLVFPADLGTGAGTCKGLREICKLIGADAEVVFETELKLGLRAAVLLPLGTTGSKLETLIFGPETVTERYWGSFIEEADPALVAIVTEIVKQVDTPYNVGYVVGQVLYEVAEGAATVGVAKAAKSPKYALMIKNIISRIEKIDCIKDKSKIISKLENLVPAAKHVDDVPKGGAASAIKFEGSAVSGSRSAASLPAAAFERVFSHPTVQACYRQIKRGEFDVVFSRGPQPSWVPEDVVLKGFTDPGTRTVTVYLRELENAEEVASVLAHESSHVNALFRHGTMVGKGKQAAEYAADLRAWIVKHKRRPTPAERNGILVDTIRRMKDARY